MVSTNNNKLIWSLAAVAIVAIMVAYYIDDRMRPYRMQKQPAQESTVTPASPSSAPMLNDEQEYSRKMDALNPGGFNGSLSEYLARFETPRKADSNTGGYARFSGSLEEYLASSNKGVNQTPCCCETCVVCSNTRK